MAASIQKMTFKRLSGDTALFVLCCGAAVFLIWALGNPARAERNVSVHASTRTAPMPSDSVAAPARDGASASPSQQDATSKPHTPFWGAWLLGLGVAVLVGADALGNRRQTDAEKP